MRPQCSRTCFVRTLNHSIRMKREWLGTNSADFAAALVRASLGALGGFGGVVSEIVTRIIPGQKLDRVVSFVQALADKTDGIAVQQALLISRLSTVLGSDLLEDGLVHASRAVRAGRTKRIAELVFWGVTGEESRHDRAKKLLSMLAALTDSELILLMYYLEPGDARTPRQHELLEKYPHVLQADDWTGEHDDDGQRISFRKGYESTLQSLRLIVRGSGGFHATHFGTLVVGTGDWQVD